MIVLIKKLITVSKLSHYILFSIFYFLSSWFFFSGCGKKEVKQKAPLKKNKNIVKNMQEHFNIYLYNKKGNMQKLKIDLKNKENAITRVLRYLEEPPANLKNYISPFPRGAKIKEVQQKNNQCIINLNQKAIGYGGGISLESNFIAALVLTATQFREIKEVQILVEGKKIRSLPEGTEILHPLKRKDFIHLVNGKK